MGSFHLGGIVIPYEAGDGTLSQTYDPKQEGEIILLGDGSSIKQALAGVKSKVKSVVRGNNNWAAAGLAGLDYTLPMVMKCMAQRTIFDPDTSVELPATRRSDAGYEPKGYGIVDGRMVETTINIVGDTANLGAIPNAQGYLAVYWPEINVFAKFSENVDANAASFGFQLDCEEV